MLPHDALIHQFKFGQVLRLRYFTEVIGSVWDDQRTLTLSGNSLYVSGLVQSVNATKGSQDQVMLEQGRISYDDKVLFVNGSVDTTSGVRVFTIATSGNTANERVYRMIEEGVISQNFGGVSIYKKIYGRILQNGSLF